MTRTDGAAQRPIVKVARDLDIAEEFLDPCRSSRTPRCLITLAPKKLIRTRRASEGSASEPSLARRVSMCKDAKLSCRGNTP